MLKYNNYVKLDAFIANSIFSLNFGAPKYKENQKNSEKVWS